MEAIRQCDLCDSIEAKVLFEGRDRLHGQPGTFHIMECQNCGLYYLDPRPSAEEIDQYYPREYISYPTAIEDESSIFRRMDRRYGVHKRCDRVIKRAGTKGRILDVGCATGVFLNGMKERGWQTYGVEPVSHAAKYARERFKLDVKEAFLETAEYERDFFDAVTMWDVLEHVPNPYKTLSEVRRILKPGGWLILSLPNPDSWERYLFNKYWAGWDIPRHFHIFNQQALSQYLNKAGLDLIEVNSFTGRHGVLVLNFQFWMTDWQVSTKTRELVLHILRSIPLRTLTWPFYGLADFLNKSSIMTVFAKKH